jgi:hypothetical protein
MEHYGRPGAYRMLTARDGVQVNQRQAGLTRFNLGPCQILARYLRLPALQIRVDMLY